MIPHSVLDLSPILEGSTAAESFASSLKLAQLAESLGYQRYWLAEHHGMPGIASAATSVLLAHIGAGTRSIRIGAGGVMLPNHSPLVIAEQFGTLESLHPGRIDLGLGRAPGSDQATARALRRNLSADVDDFPQEVLSLMDYLSASPQQQVRAVPGRGLEIPIWILGSSTYGAQLAAMLGLPYAFASHFAPADLMQAIALYRSLFKPSARLQKPYVMLGVPVFAAATDEEAAWHASSAQQAMVSLRMGRPIPLPPPKANYLASIGPREHAILNNVQACAAIGSPDTVRRSLADFVARTGADELMIATQIYDLDARLASYRIASEVLSALQPGQA